MGGYDIIGGKEKLKGPGPKNSISGKRPHGFHRKWASGISPFCTVFPEGALERGETPMLYFKSSQFVPGKGDAWTYYECDDDRKVLRYVTSIPETGETKRVSDPPVKELYESVTMTGSSQEEFEQYWPQGADEAPAAAETAEQKQASGQDVPFKRFSLEMTVSEAMAVDPRVSEAFAAFHLGGCAHCAVGGYETIGQVCAAYGVDPSTLLEVLEDVVREGNPRKADAAPQE